MSRQQKAIFPKFDSGVPGYQYLRSYQLLERQDGGKLPHRVLRTKRKHVQRACERCRVKKAKCDGRQPCGRCVTYNQACIFRDRKATQEKVYSRGFVEMLLSQHAVHVKALRDLYKRCVRREGFPGSPLQDSIQGYPGTHAILDRLGLIKYAEEAVEDPQKVLADIVEYVKCLESASDCCLDSVESTTDTSDTIAPEDDISPSPESPRESPELATFKDSDHGSAHPSEAQHSQRMSVIYRPWDSQHADTATLDGAVTYVDEGTWGYSPYEAQHTSAGAIVTSNAPQQSYDMPNFHTSPMSSSWTEIPDQSYPTFGPLMTSHASVPGLETHHSQHYSFFDQYGNAQTEDYARGFCKRYHHAGRQSAGDDVSGFGANYVCS